jgi:hypothetical protein
MIPAVKRSLLLAVLALPALAACGSSPTKTITKATPPTRTQASVPTGTTSTPSGPPVLFQGAVGRPAQKPASLELTADGTLSVERVQWTSWGGAEATGTGSAMYHGCTPNCAEAPVHTALVSIRLSTVRVCGGRRYYSGVALTLNSGQLLDKEFLQRSWSPC